MQWVGVIPSLVSFRNQKSLRLQHIGILFMEQNDCFSVSFFEESQRAALQFCGTHSGRDYDKAKETVVLFHKRKGMSIRPNTTEERRLSPHFTHKAP